MKKLISARILSASLITLCSLPALADFNNSDIYINNKTTKDITVNQPVRQEWHSKGTANKYTMVQGVKNLLKQENVGTPLTIKPGERKKIATMGRDQGLYNQFAGSGSRITTLSFTTNNNQPHTFESIWFMEMTAQLPSPSTLYYNGQLLKKPITQPGLKVHTYYVFPKLYHDIEMLFDDTIK